MRVLDAEHEADVGEALGLAAMGDRVEDEDLRRRQAGLAGRRHAADHPALEGMIGEDHPELDLRQRRHGAVGQMCRGDDGAEAPLSCGQWGFGFGVVGPAGHAQPPENIVRGR